MRHKDYDPHGIDRLMTAILANAVEDASGNPMGVEEYKRFSRYEYNTQRLAWAAIDWLVDHGAEWLAHLEIEDRGLYAWITQQEARLFGERKNATVQGAVSAAADEPNAIRPGRPAADRVRSVQHGRTRGPRRNGRVHRAILSSNDPGSTRSEWDKTGR